MNDIQNNIINKYEALRSQHLQDFQSIKSKENVVSILRLVTVCIFLISLYVMIKNQSHLLFIIPAMLVLVGFFLFLVRWHDHLTATRKFKKALSDVNEDELNYLRHQTLSYPNGLAYLDVHHAYAYDLDIFGNHSLYQHLNRTGTYKGSEILANHLLAISSQSEILSNQAAIAELSEKVAWRQSLFAQARLTYDNATTYQKLIDWCQEPSYTLSKLVVLLSYLLPIFLWATLLYGWISGNSDIFSVSSFLFTLNLMLTFGHFKHIKNAIIGSDGIPKIIKSYGSLSATIENENLQAPKLQTIKNKLFKGDQGVSQEINLLGSLLSDLDNVQNLLGAIITNGLGMFHLHTLRKLGVWKQQHASEVSTWLEAIGEIESLNSFANFYYNNPDFVFPTLNQNHDIIMENAGHPMINVTKRIGNPVDFSNQRFVILTGSNMSGKSTYLRTLGINMILAGTGAPVCASKATIHPMKVLVTMRLSDSLTENESYFYAEVSRLKQIMDQLQGEVCFVLLDEILRGTNSDDKRSGTIKVIKKIIEKNAVGIIATHDIEVCHTTDEYPEIMNNQCFEAEIKDNDLYFDYRIRPGICKNKSATFLMEKMGVI